MARTTVLALLALAAAPALRAQSLEGLGDLPGGGFTGRAWGVSADGTEAIRGTHALRLDAARLPAGVYIVRAVMPAGAARRRVTVVR